MPSRQRLSRELVLEAALRVIDRSGLDGCTMRAVASDLGIEAMSLYWYLPSKQALLEGVVELVLAEVEESLGEEEDWEAALYDVARALREVLMRHRNALPLLTERPVQAYIVAARMTDRNIALLEAAGFDRTTAIRASRTLSRYAIGFILGEVRAQAAPPAPPDREAVGEVVRAVVDDDPEQFFEFGLELLMAGLGEALRAHQDGLPAA